jgi:hypothetical protein
MSNEETKDQAKLLEFLQRRKLDMMREIPGFIDARVAPEGDRLIVRVAAPLVDEPRLVDSEGEEIPVKIQIDFPDGKPAEGKVVIGMGEEGAATAEVQNDDPGEGPGKVGTVAVPFKRPIGPHEAGARDSAAYEAWVKRHKLNVKRS